jgi:hypothetical protein
MAASFWQVSYCASRVSGLTGLRLVYIGALCATCAHALFAELAVHAYRFLMKNNARRYDP